MNFINYSEPQGVPASGMAIATGLPSPARVGPWACPLLEAHWPDVIRCNPPRSGSGPAPATLTGPPPGPPAFRRSHRAPRLVGELTRFRRLVPGAHLSGAPHSSGD